MHDIAALRFRNLPREEQFAAQELNQLDGGAQTRRAGEIIGAALAVLVRDGNMPPSEARDILARVHPFAEEDIPPQFQNVAPDDGGPVLGSPEGRTAGAV